MKTDATDATGATDFTDSTDATYATDATVPLVPLVPLVASGAKRKRALEEPCPLAIMYKARLKDASERENRALRDREKRRMRKECERYFAAK
jgi:hypothetical protein